MYRMLCFTISVEGLVQGLGVLIYSPLSPTEDYKQANLLTRDNNQVETAFWKQQLPFYPILNRRLEK